MSLATRAAEQQRTQQGLMVLLAQEMAALWQIITLGEFARTVPEWQAAAIVVCQRYALAATTAAADYYEAEREAAGAVGPFTVELADIPPEKAGRSLSWAVKDLWLPEEEEPPPIEERLRSAQTKAAGVAEKLVEDAARDTVIDATHADPQARGWARYASAGACDFCALLALRGAVYSEDTVRFRAHDHCTCWAVPVFRGQQWEPPEHVREWQRIYREATRDVTGSRAARAAFRRALTEARQ